jgi:hypothetical protein
VRRDDPPVTVWLDHDNYRRGDKAPVNIKLRDDGYLVVLPADADGRVRVLFPLDPGDDAFVRGGEAREIRDAVTTRRSRSTSARARGSFSRRGPRHRSSSRSSCAAITGTTAY